MSAQMVQMLISFALDISNISALTSIYNTNTTAVSFAQLSAWQSGMRCLQHAIVLLRRLGHCLCCAQHGHHQAPIAPDKHRPLVHCHLILFSFSVLVSAVALSGPVVSCTY